MASGSQPTQQRPHVRWRHRNLGKLNTPDLGRQSPNSLATTSKLSHALRSRRNAALDRRHRDHSPRQCHNKISTRARSIFSTQLMIKRKHHPWKAGRLALSRTPG
jgi:hypothetical protein